MMKTLMTLTMVVLLLGTDIGYAKNQSTITVDKSVKTEKKNNQTCIKNLDGEVLFSTEQIISEDEIKHIFNLQSLEDGLYTFEMVKDFEIKVKPFAIANNEVVFIERAERVFFKPVIRQDAQKLMVSLLDFTTKSVELIIYFEDEVIYSETLKDRVEYNRVLQLDKTKKGNYKTIVKANGRVYKEYFTL
ncbi:hypothetical protein RM697_04110 [Ichthyenterobacterium sp. W332]|uniref:Uncharacterized protein n=1 Tax=Microcosmobacter mediterraneus TaxID=3075607 RepID=A0ABU2YKQ5_9FLAO|nr:hypothetical protein [Ichthyenterobacterium sp. W332]MDT0557815.1 hypothetical protein [Ichthyenterobacterium sp. W332]